LGNPDIADFSHRTGYYDLEEQLAEIQGHRHDDDYEDSIRSLRNFIQNRDQTVSLFGEETYNAMLLSYRIPAQEQLLKGFNLNVRELYFFYLPLIMEQKFGRKFSPSNKEQENIPEIPSDWIAKSPIRIQLPNTPLMGGDTELFMQQTRASLETFHQEHPIFKPLHIPVNLNILYKPPKDSKTDYNDLDNIMRKIVPVFNEIFKPPSTHVSHVNLDNIRDDKIYKSLKRMQDKVPKSIRTSISGYDIFKMPRNPADDSDGYLSAKFSSGPSSLSSPIYVIDRLIEKWIECFED